MDLREAGCSPLVQGLWGRRSPHHGLLQSQIFLQARLPAALGVSKGSTMTHPETGWTCTGGLARGPSPHHHPCWVSWNASEDLGQGGDQQSWWGLAWGEGAAGLFLSPIFLGVSCVTSFLAHA